MLFSTERRRRHRTGRRHGLFLLAWLWAGALPLCAAAETARLGNRLLEIGFDGRSGRLVELTDRTAKQNFAGSLPSPGGLWQLEFGEGAAAALSPADARTFRLQKKEGPDPGLFLTWSGFENAGAPGLQVEVTVQLEREKAESRWRISVLHPGRKAPARIRFPRILHLPKLRQERLVLPFWVGLLRPEPRAYFSSSPPGTRREYDYPGHCSVQSMAFYEEDGPGLYASCDDTAAYRKLFAAFSDPEAGLNLEIVHLPERASTEVQKYTLPYAVRLGTFRGSWFQAAAIYRSWALDQSWARESRWKRGVVPSWIPDTGLWVWNRGRSPGVLGPAEVLQRHAGVPVSVFWHWWHGCAYDTGFPEYLPPREGAEPFREALRRAQQQGIHALVYMNQRLWGMTTGSWKKENAADYAVKGADGNIRPEVYNRFSRLPCATMCMGTAFWRNKYAGLAAEALTGLGVDGIYMDQACSSLACFDPDHGHPLGGGTYWMQGFRALAADIRQRAAARSGVGLAGEGCAENWLPYLDLMLALEVSRERYAGPDGWEAIPFFQAVYHSFGVFYGNYSSLTYPPYDDLWPAEYAPRETLPLLDRKFSRQFYLEQGRSFVWGQQPTLANFLPSHLQERTEEIEYVVRIARARKAALPFLQEGTMLPPPKVELADEEIPISRLSIYAGQQEALKEFRKKVPVVLASAWKAPDGRVALAVTNAADRPVSPGVVLRSGDYSLPGRLRVREVSGNGGEPAARRRGAMLTLTLDLPPLAVRVYELQPLSPSKKRGE